MAHGTNSNGAGQEDPSRIFIASTAEAAGSDWFGAAVSEAVEEVEEKYPGVDFQPWYDSFKPGDITAPRLIEIARDVLGAVIFLTAEDTIESREVESLAPRDNLLLETGLFVGQLDLPNVLLLRQRDSKWPSDLDGIAAKDFKPPKEEGSGNAAVKSRDIARHLIAFVERLMRNADSLAHRAIEDEIQLLRLKERKLRGLLEREETNEPLVDLEPTGAYLHAVKHVGESFTTTTYLKSEFWTSREIQVTAANEQMLKRVKAGGGVARRIILLSRPLEEELKDQRKSRHLARSRAPQKVEQMNREFRQLEEANRDLVEKGFKVRVVHDREELFARLPPDIDFDQNDTELALYDGRRLDVFAGFTSKRRSTVHSYFEGHFGQFQTLRDSVDRYFEQLWESDEAHDFTLFTEKMQALIEEVDGEVDYTEHWLTIFDNQTGPDGELKQEEGAFVLDRLQRQFGDNRPLAAGHIDLGTCTGRYMAEIAPVVAPGGSIVGVDNDPDCLRMLNYKKQTGALQPRVEFRSGDIRYRDRLPEGQFPIVTCMMGTLCHLRRGPTEGDLYRDDWQAGLENVADLLSTEGDAFVAVWDERILDEDLDLLEIYPSHAKNVLRRNTPLAAELAARLDQVSLRIVSAETLQNRLRVLHLHHNDREVSG